MVGIFAILFDNIITVRIVWHGNLTINLLSICSCQNTHQYLQSNLILLSMGVNRTGQRCVETRQEESVGRCIVKYTEETNGCTTYQLMANKTKNLCVGKKEVEPSKLQNWSEERLYNVSGRDQTQRQCSKTWRMVFPPDIWSAKRWPRPGSCRSE